jgi:hypothetical protein
VNTGSQRENRQVRGEYRLTNGRSGVNAGLQRENIYVRGLKQVYRERPGRSGVNTAIQRENRQVWGEYRLTKRGQTGQG